MSKRNYYEVLEVTKTASDTEIKSSYRRLAMKFHPDRNPGDQLAEEKFKEAAEAYAVLADSKKRGLYDRFGHAGVGAAAGFLYALAGGAWGRHRCQALPCGTRSGLPPTMSHRPNWPCTSFDTSTSLSPAPRFRFSIYGSPCVVAMLGIASRSTPARTPRRD